MPEWLSARLPDGWTGWHLAAFGTAFAVVSAVASVLVVGYVLARLPADYFVNPEARRPIDRHPVLKVLVLVARNLLGYALVALGVVLSLPGVPGQGLLTVLMGVMLIDVPGKYRAERWLLNRSPVRAAVNGLRAKFGSPPLLAEPVQNGKAKDGPPPVATS